MTNLGKALISTAWMECTFRKGTKLWAWSWNIEIRVVTHVFQQVLTDTDKVVGRRGGNEVCSSLRSILCTAAGQSLPASALTLLLGQLKLHLETHCYMTSGLVISTKRESQSTPNWSLEASLPLGLVGLLGHLLLGPQRKLVNKYPGALAYPSHWTSDCNTGWGHHHSSIWSTFLFDGPYMDPKPGPDTKVQFFSSANTATASSFSCSGFSLLEELVIWDSLSKLTIFT